MLLCDIIMGNPQVPVALGIGRYQLIHPLPARLKGGPLHAKGLQLLNLQGRELIAAVGLPLGGDNDKPPDSSDPKPWP